MAGQPTFHVSFTIEGAEDGNVIPAVHNALQLLQSQGAVVTGEVDLQAVPSVVRASDLLISLVVNQRVPSDGVVKRLPTVWKDFLIAAEIDTWCPRCLCHVEAWRLPAHQPDHLRRLWAPRASLLALGNPDQLELRAIKPVWQERFRVFLNHVREGRV